MSMAATVLTFLRAKLANPFVPIRFTPLSWVKLSVQVACPVGGTQSESVPVPGIVNLMVGSGMSAIRQPAAPKTDETSTNALKSLTQHLLKSLHTDSSTLLGSRFGTGGMAAGLVPFA